jgi:hypothetical protein
MAHPQERRAARRDGGSGALGVSHKDTALDGCGCGRVFCGGGEAALENARDFLAIAVDLR